MAVKEKGSSAEGRALKKERKFSKQQLLAARRFQGRKDIVNALLDPDKQYTAEAVEKMIETYMKGQVN